MQARCVSLKNTLYQSCKLQQRMPKGQECYYKLQTHEQSSTIGVLEIPTHQEQRRLQSVLDRRTRTSINRNFVNPFGVIMWDYRDMLVQHHCRNALLPVRHSSYTFVFLRSKAVISKLGNRPRWRSS